VSVEEQFNIFIKNKNIPFEAIPIFKFYIEEKKPISDVFLSVIYSSFRDYNQQKIVDVLVSQEEAGVSPYIKYTDIEFHNCSQVYIKYLTNGSFEHSWSSPFGTEEVLFDFTKLDNVEHVLDLSVTLNFKTPSDVLIIKTKFDENVDFFSDLLLKNLFPVYRYKIVDLAKGSQEKVLTNKMTLHFNNSANATDVLNRLNFISKSCNLK
jgi:hypothetical protein